MSKDEMPLRSPDCYKDHDLAVAAASQRDTEMAAVSALMRLNQMPTPEELHSGAVDLVKKLF